MFVFIFFDIDPTKSFELALGSYSATQALGKLVEANVKFMSATGMFSGIMDRKREWQGPLASYGVHMIRKLLEKGLNVEETTWSQILPTAGAMIGNQAQVFTQIMDVYLGLPEYKEHWPNIVKTARQDSPEADEKILRYCMEAIRIHGTFGSYRTADTNATIDNTGFAKDNDGQVKVKPGDSVFVSFVSSPWSITVVAYDVQANQNATGPS